MKRKIFSHITIRLPLIVVLLLLIASGISGYYYYYGEPNTKSTALYGGLFSGLILVIVQFSFSWSEYRALSKFHELGIRDILLDRDDRNFYHGLIKSANKRIYVMGVTAARFMEHFADLESDRSETRVLLEAMSRGTDVRILLPESNYLLTEKDKTKAQTTTEFFAKVAEHYDNFHYRFFDHEPAHSIFVVDEECIIGPVLPGVASKDTPAIYMRTEGKYAEKYLNYFDHEWTKATPLTRD
jgi:hypothetical protein